MRWAIVVVLMACNGGSGVTDAGTDAVDVDAADYTCTYLIGTESVRYEWHNTNGIIACLARDTPECGGCLKTDPECECIADDYCDAWEPEPPIGDGWGKAGSPWDCEPI